jgi:hypothetical protein
MNPEQIMAAASLLVVEKFPNDVLSAAHNSVTGFPSMSTKCMAYQPLLDAYLIREGGRAHDRHSLERVLGHEITRRMKAGTFPGPRAASGGE